MQRRRSLAGRRRGIPPGVMTAIGEGVMKGQGAGEGTLFVTAMGVYCPMGVY